MTRFSPSRFAPALTLVALGTLFAAPLPAATPPDPEKVTTVEGITEYRLGNGARVLLFPDPASARVTVNMTVLVGSRHEGYGETGMAHLLEHMLFKGTPTFPHVPKALRDHGAEFNGSTWVDRTNYYEVMPATEENLEFGIKLEADRLVHSFVKREDLVSEMTVVRNEFEAGENDPPTILSQRMLSAAYEWHNYGKSTIGNRADIERVPIENLQAFYRKHYQPDNIVLIVAGKFDEAKALALVQQYFAPIPRPKRQLDGTYTEEPPQDGERTVTLRRVGKVAVAGAVYHIPSGRHPDFPAVAVLNNVLTAEPAGRLYKALVETHKASSVGGTAFGWHDPGVVEFDAECPPENLPAVREKLLATVEELAAAPATAEEVERAKTHLLRQWKHLFDRSDSAAIALSEWVARGDWRLLFLHRDRLEKVTPEDVNRVAAAYLKRVNRTVGEFQPSDRPQRAEVPDAPPAGQMLDGYKGRSAVAAGEAFEPTPENLDARTERFAVGGVKAAFLPKKTRGEAVHLQLVLHFGNEESLKGQRMPAEVLGDLLTRGTKAHTRQQIKDSLDSLEATLSASSSSGALTVDVQAKRATLPAVLKLLAEVLRSPTFPAVELDILRNEYRDQLQKALTEPTTLAERRLRRLLSTYPKGDVRYTPTIEEELEELPKVTREQVVTLYEKQLGAQAGELAVVGDFDPAAARSAFEAMLKDWAAPTPYRRIPRPAHPEVPGAREVIKTPDKANAVYIAGESFPVSDGDPDYPALELGNYILGGGPLSSRLADRVRQKEGLSYTIGSFYRASSKDPASSLGVFAIYNPANAGKLEKAIAEELDRYLKDGPTTAEVSEGAKAYLKQQQSQRADDSNLTGLWTDHLENGRTFAFDAEVEKKITALTPAQVKEAFGKHIDPKRLVIVVAGDLDKKK
jgi:zinc protease